MICLRFILIFAISINHINSYVSLQRMLNTELKIIKNVGGHVEQLAIVISKVESGVDKLLSSKWSHMGKAEYVGTPLTAMVMVRRLAQEWPPVAATVGRFTKLRQLQLGKVRWPTVKDIQEAARVVMRSHVQKHNVSTAVLNRGIQSDMFVTNVTAADCLEIAHQYMKRELFTEAKEWLQYALTEIQDSEDNLLRERVLYYLAVALCFSDDAKSSIRTLRSILRENPRSKPPRDLEVFYSIMGTHGCLYSEGKLDDYLNKVHYETGIDLAVVEFFRDSTESKKHSRLCQSEGKIVSNLRCRYVHYKQPHLMFQPFKLEELQLDPPVVRFYDLVSDREAESLMKRAKGQMEPAFVGFGEHKRKSEFRTSQIAWLRWNAKDWLDRRISEATRLDTYYAEDHQVARYTVSGEYLPHVDHFSYKEKWIEDRLATLMFYLSDVEQGGNTVFTEWNLSVPPVKNSAVLWFNYKPNGKGDDNSEHSGCPVLKGTKWVLNKWFHNEGNDVNFPCALNKHGSFKGFYL